MLYNRTKICEKALGEINVLGLGESAEQIMLDDAAERLNEIIYSEQGKGKLGFMFSTGEEEIPLNKHEEDDEDPDTNLPTDFLRPITAKLKLNYLNDEFSITSTTVLDIDLVSHTDFFSRNQDQEETDYPQKCYIQSSHADTNTLHFWPPVKAVNPLVEVYLMLTYERAVYSPTEDLVSIPFIPNSLTELYKLKLAESLAERYAISMEKKASLKTKIRELNPIISAEKSQKNIGTTFSPRFK